MSESLRGALEAQAGDPRSPILLYHLLDGKLTTRDMRADQLAETRSGAQLRLNKYSNHVRRILLATIDDCIQCMHFVFFTLQHKNILEERTSTAS